MANSAVVGILRALLTANTAEFETGMQRGSESAKRFSRDMKAIGTQATQVGTALTRTLTLPLVGSIAAVAKAAMGFESSFAGVRKTVEASEAELAQMETQFRALAKSIPINVDELNRLGEAAGALGIPKAQIVDFARVMGLLGQTTNLTADQAAEGVAKVQNIFNSAGQDTDRFAATLVALGNDGASTEDQILSMATRIAGAGNAINLTQGEVLGFASALSSVGLEAEAGGTAISRVFIDMAAAVGQGGDAVKGFAQVTGQSIADFTQSFREDAATAVLGFMQGLGRIKSAGGDLLGTLEALGFSEIRVRDALLRTAGAGDLVARALTLQKSAWQQNTALTVEAEKRFATLESRLGVLWNQIRDVGIELGTALMPSFQATVTLAQSAIPVVEMLARGFAALPTPVQGLALGLVAVAAVIGPMVYVLGQLALSAAAVAGAFTAKGIATRALSAALLTLNGTLPAAAAGIRAVGVGSVLTTTQVTALGMTLQGLGAIAAGVGSVFLGWQLGRVIAQVFELDTKIGNLTARLLGFGDVAAQTAGAKADTLRLASERVGRAVTDVSEAVRINTQWLEHQKAKYGLAALAADHFVGPLQAVATGQALVGVTARKSSREVTAMAEALEELRSVGDDADATLQRIDGTIVEGVQYYLEAGVSQRALATAYALTDAQVRAVATAMRQEQETLEAGIASLDRSRAARDEATAAIGRQVRGLDVLRTMAQQAGALRLDHTLIDPNLSFRVPDLRQYAAHMQQALREPLQGAFSGFLQRELGPSILRAFQGGGNVARSIGGTIGGQLGQAMLGDGTSGLGKFFAGNVGGKLSKLLGGTLGSIIPGLGTLAGGLIGGLFGKLFNNPEKQINKLREEFVQLHGGLGPLNQKAAEAGVSLQRLLSAKNPKQYQAAINELNAAFDRQAKTVSAVQAGIDELAAAVHRAGGTMPAALKPTVDRLLDMVGLTEDQRAAILALRDGGSADYEALQRRAEAYGISLAQLGPAFQQADIDRTAGEIIDTFTALTDAGADAGGVLAGMGDEVSALVQQAIQYGRTLPEELRPIIENLRASGQLVDANGNAIEDLSALSFADTPLKKSTDAIVAAIERLGELLTGIPGQARAAADGIPDNPFEHWRVPGGPLIPTHDAGDIAFASEGGRVTRTGLVRTLAAGGFAGGGSARGTDIIPAMLTPNELVVTAEQQGHWRDNAHALLQAALEGGQSAIAMVTQPAQLVLRDGRILADVVFEGLPAAARRAGVL